MLVQNWLQTLRVQWQNNSVKLGRGGKRRRVRAFRSHAVEPVEARLLLTATAVDDAVTASAGAPITIDVLANDTSSADSPNAMYGASSLAIAELGGATHGTTELRPADGMLWDYYLYDQQYAGPYGSGASSFDDWYANSMNGDLSSLEYVVVYTPEAGFSGIDSFTYTLTDTSGELSTASVTVDVTQASGPLFSQNTYNFEIPLDAADGTVIGTVTAAGATSYSNTADDVFSVQTNGDVVLDFAYNLQYLGAGATQNFIVSAWDASQPGHTSQATVNIAITAATSSEIGGYGDDIYDDYVNDQSNFEDFVEQPEYSPEDYYDIAKDSPIGDYLDPYAEEFYEFSEQAQQQIDQAETEAEQQQQEAEQSGADSTQADETDSTTYGLSADQTTGTEGTGENPNGDAASEPTSDGEATNPQEGNDGGYRPFELPDGIVFNTTTVPADSEFEDLMLLLPTGTTSFTTTTSNQNESLEEDVDPALGPGTRTTDITSDTTIEQTYTSPTEWTVTQTITNVFSTSETLTPGGRVATEEGEDGTEANETSADEGTAEGTTSADGEGSADDAASDIDTQKQTIERTGSSTWSVTVINGTQTVMTYSMTDTYTFETGNLPGTDETDEESKWEIPEEWTTAAAGPATPQATDDVTNVTRDTASADNEGEQAGADGDNTAANSDSDATVDIWGQIFGTAQDESESATADSGNDAQANDGDTAAGDGSQTDGEAEEPAEEDFYGSRMKSVSTFTITITETLVTLPDGTAGRTYSFGYDTTQSLTSLSAGRFSVDESEGEILAVESEVDEEAEGTEEETAEHGTEGMESDGTVIPLINGAVGSDEAAGQGDSAESDGDAAEDGDEQADDAPIDLKKIQTGGNGQSVDASMKFMNFGSSSSGFGFNMSMTVPDGATDEQMEAATITGGMNIDMGNSSGNMQSQSLKAARQSTTGAEVDGNESFSSFFIESDETSGGSSHFNLKLAFDFDTSEEPENAEGTATTSSTSSGEGTEATGDQAATFVAEDGSGGTESNPGGSGNTEGSSDEEDDNTLTFGNTSFGNSKGKAVSIDRSFSEYDGGSAGNLEQSIFTGGNTAGGSSSYSNSIQLTEDGLTISARNTVNSNSHHEQLTEYYVDSPEAPEINFDENTYTGVYSVDTIDDDQESKNVMIFNSRITTGYDITFGDDGVGIEEVFEIDITSSQESISEGTTHTTYADYMGGSSDRLEESDYTHFNETTVIGNLEDGITVTETEKNSSRTKVNNNGTVTEIITINTPDPVITTISLVEEGQQAGEGSDANGEASLVETNTDVQSLIGQGNSDPTPEELLAEYKDRQVRAERLKQQIAEETDPDMKAFYQGLLDTENDVLNDIRQSALDAGVEQSELDNADADALIAAIADPIDAESLGLYESSGLNVLVDSYVGYWTGLGHGTAMVGNALTLHQTPLNGYVDNLIEENGGVYGFANGSANVGAVSLYAAGGLIGLRLLAAGAGTAVIGPSATVHPMTGLAGVHTLRGFYQSMGARWSPAINVQWMEKMMSAKTVFRKLPGGWHYTQWEVGMLQSAGYMRVFQWWLPPVL